MLEVKVEGLLDNIIIFDNELYFKCYFDSLEEEDLLELIETEGVVNYG